MKKNEIVKMLFFDIISAIFLGISVDLFVVNANFAPGGVTGLSVLLNYLFKVPIGLTIILLNIPIVLLTYKKIGKKFFLVSAKSIVICSIFIDYVIIHFPPYSGNRIVSVLCAGVFAGIGYSILFNANSSTGGTDFIVVALKKWKENLSYGVLVFIIDGLIVLLSSIVFKETSVILYGLLYVIITSVAMDMTTNIIMKIKRNKRKTRKVNHFDKKIKK